MTVKSWLRGQFGRRARGRARGDDDLDGVRIRQLIQNQVAVVQDRRFQGDLRHPGVVLATNAEQVGVHHHVGARDSELAQQPLDALAGIAHQDAMPQQLVGRGILAHQ